MAQLAAAAAAAGAAALGVAACYCSGGGGGEPQGSAAAPEGAAAAPVAASSSSVVAVEGDEEFEALVAANKSVLVDFSAAWCRPCKAIAPLFAESAPTLPPPRRPPAPLPPTPRVGAGWRRSTRGRSSPRSTLTCARRRRRSAA